MSTPQSPYMRRLGALEKRINTLDREESMGSCIDLLKKVTSVVRDAEAKGASNLADVVHKAGIITDSVIDWAYSDGDVDFMQSFAHTPDSPLIEDPLSMFPSGLATSIFEVLLRRINPESVTQSMREEFLPPSWKDTHPPHPKSTRLSRFRNDLTFSCTDATPVARTILQARCEATADSIACPVGSAISADSSTLAIVAQGGWKNRDPILTLYFLDEDNASGDEWAYQSIEPGLAEVAGHVAMDDLNKLALVADSFRIKTFFWGSNGTSDFGGWKPNRGKNVHTMDSRRYSGPIAVLPGGRVARAGKGGVGIWAMSELPTHKGGRRIGGKIKDLDSMRDNDDDEIERSIGSAPTSVLKFATDSADLEPADWCLHAPTGHMLVTESSRKNPGHYGCFAIDLEAGGKKVSQFLGHGGQVESFCVSPGDANVFATACSDGYARLYDVRHPLPIMTIDSGRSSEFCQTVQLVHPDGIPVVFTGGDRSQSIKAWDVRARQLTYELATGNNAVHALSWDAECTTLYAATGCDYMDRNGNNYGYRRARIPRWADLIQGYDTHKRGEDEDEDMGDEYDDDEDDDEDDEDDGDDDDEERCWPKEAHHSETFFGYAYDAGEHVLLRYKYMEDPDSERVPIYGDATMERNGYW